MITAVLLTKNEEKNIVDCLETLGWCEEIVVVDDDSEDRTIEIISNFQFAEKLCLFPISNEKFKIKIYQRHLDGDFAAQRNFGLAKARGPARDASQSDAGGEWVLFIDADERVTKELRDEILRCTQDDKYDGFYVKRKDFWGGRWLEHGETGKIKLLRLARKNSGKWARPVHEAWEVKGKVGELTNPLLHYPHQTIGEFIKNINFYTDLNSQVFYEQGVKVKPWQILVYPLAKFVKNYFLKAGFLDGMAGMVQSLLMSFHSFLTRAKLWQLQNENN